MLYLILATLLCLLIPLAPLLLMRRVPLAPAPPVSAHDLNRLGDLLFVLARAVNVAVGQADVPWQKPHASSL